MFYNKIKERMKNGEAVLGSFFNSNCPDIAEIMGAAGLDFIVIDCEHGPGTPESIVNCVRAAEARGMTPIVRVTEDTRTGILRFLDIGAHGILVPQLESAAQAASVIQKAKYAPIGMRGMAVPRASTWGFDENYTQRENDETLILVQCENMSCYEHLEEVGQVEGLDAIFLGPYDMSQALGIPGQIKAPQMLEVEKKILEVCKKNGKFAGIFVNTIDDALAARAAGWQFILMGMDIATIGYAYKHDVDIFNKK